MEEIGHLVEGNLIGLIVEVRVGRTGHDEEFLIIPFEAFEGVFTEVAGMGLFAVDDQDGTLYFAEVLQNRVGNEAHSRRDVPAAVGVQTAGMVSFIISPPWNML